MLSCLQCLLTQSHAIMEVLAKALESSTQALLTPVASWWWQQVPVSKEVGFFSKHEPAPKL